MRINGFFRKGPLEAAYITSTVKIDSLGITGRVEFLLDTGATRTILSDRDALRLGIDYKLLEKTTPSLGIGGRVDTYLSKNAQLIFITSENAEYTQRLPVFHVLKHKRADSDILAIPSVIGRDVLNKFALFYNRPKDEVCITRS